MGMAKHHWMEEQERGFGTVDKFICPKCLTDRYLAELAEANAEACICDYCGAESDTPIAAPFDVVVEAIMDGIWSEWSTPDRAGYAWDGETKSYFGEVLDTDDLIGLIGFPSDDDEFLDDFFGALTEHAFCGPDAAQLSKTAALIYSWERFVTTVQQHRRYMFHEFDTEDDVGDNTLQPHEFLAFLGRAMLKHGVVRTLSTGDRVYRARIARDGASYTVAASLGSPKPGYAKSGRMSAAGISVFYGAVEANTCTWEILAAQEVGTYQLDVGTFAPVAPLRILDLTHLPEVPSLYDSHNREYRPETKFVRAFIHDVSTPVKPGSQIDVHYAPTQIVSEYIRYVLKDDHGGFDGVAYASAQVEGGACVVLFVPHDECIDANTPRPWKPKLNLVHSERHAVDWVPREQEVGLFE